MNRRKLFSILIALTLILITIPITFAVLDEWVISEVDEDCFWSTYLFDENDMMYLQGDNMRIIGWYRFEGPDVLKQYYPISEAYLSVMTMGPGLTDPDASMTLYGVPAKQGGALSYLEDMDQINGPYTSSYVNVNLSSFVGNGVWHNITVTNIVKEINQGWYFYDGHDVAFVTLSTDNHDAERYVSSEENGYAAKLYVHYETPDPEDPEYDPDLPDDAEWVEDYRNYTIWIKYGAYTIDYVFTEGTASPYDIMYDYIGNEGSPVKISESEDQWVTSWANRKNIVRMSDGTTYFVYHKLLAGKYQIYVKKSVDGGANWIDDTRISTYAGMASYDQGGSTGAPGIAVDSQGYLHVIWVGKATGYTTDDQVWYAKYTTSWVTPVRISTYTEMEDNGQYYPSIAVDSQDYLHVGWSGSALGYLSVQVWYAKYTTSWVTPIRISTYAGMDTHSSSTVSITVSSQDYLHVVFLGTATGYELNAQVWYAKYNTSWVTPVRISTYANMGLNDQSTGSIAVDSQDYLHVVWVGKATGFTEFYQIWYAKYNTSWVTPVRISTYAGMEGYGQYNPSIAVAEDSDYLHVLWTGKATGFSDFNKVWYRNYTDSWQTIECLHPTGQNMYPNIRWSRFPGPVDDIYLVTDENGTIVPTWNGDNFTDIDDLKDYIDDEVIGYPDPEDPDPSGWEDPVYWSIHRFKLLLFLIGMILLVGSPVYGFAARPEAATWIMLMMNMLIGVALLWSLQTM